MFVHHSEMLGLRGQAMCKGGQSREAWPSSDAAVMAANASGRSQMQSKLRNQKRKSLVYHDKATKEKVQSLVYKDLMLRLLASLLSKKVSMKQLCLMFELTTICRVFGAPTRVWCELEQVRWKEETA